jgi:hypothetical protein
LASRGCSSKIRHFRAYPTAGECSASRGIDDEPVHLGCIFHVMSRRKGLDFRCDQSVSDGVPWAYKSPGGFPPRRLRAICGVSVVTAPMPS